MNKIPVGETVAHAYGFAFRQFPKLLGIVWAPLVVSIAVGLMTTPGFFGNHLAIGDHEEIARRSLQLLPALLVFSLFIRAMIATGVTELALGKRTGTTLVYFSLGASVWRFIGAWLLFALVMLMIYIGLIILMVLLLIGGAVVFKSVSFAPGAAQIAAVALVGVIVFALFAALIFVAARLTFLIPPVVVEEKKVDLARGWELTRGNFWRIVVIGIALFIPLIAIQCAIFVAVYGTGVFGEFGQFYQMAMHQAKPDVIQQHANALSNEMTTRALAVWPYTTAVGIVFQTFAFGLTYGASAFAYRALLPMPGSSMRD